MEETPSAQAGGCGCLHSFSERRVSRPVGGAEPSVTTDGSREEAARTPPTTGDLEPGHPSARPPRCWNSSSCAQRAPTGTFLMELANPEPVPETRRPPQPGGPLCPAGGLPGRSPSATPALICFSSPSWRRSPSCEQTAPQSPAARCRVRKIPLLREVHGQLFASALRRTTPCLGRGAGGLAPCRLSVPERSGLRQLSTAGPLAAGCARAEVRVPKAVCPQTTFWYPGGRLLTESGRSRDPLSHSFSSCCQ